MLVAFQCCLKILSLRTFTCVTWITRHLWQPALAHLSVPPALGFAQVGVFSSGWVCLSRGALGRCNFLFSGLEGMRNDLAISPPSQKHECMGCLAKWEPLEERGTPSLRGHRSPSAARKGAGCGSWLLSETSSGEKQQRERERRESAISLRSCSPLWFLFWLNTKD